MSIPGARILKYTLLPQVLPRAQGILQEGFGTLAYWVACVFANARILPKHHPYLNPVNIDHYGMANVLAEAGRNIRFSFRNSDQVIIFGIVLLGCVLLLAQVGVMGFSLMFHAAHAAVAEPTTFADYFLSPIPESDVSFMILDRIFGVPDLYNSCVALNMPCLGALQSDGNFPFPYQLALQNMLAFYSEGLLFVAAIIFGYMVFTIVAETAESGTFFGKRFNRVWAPLRLIAAIGLLIPMGYGYNAAQWIVLYVAKYGSGFGTNAWNWYVADFVGEETFLGATSTLVSKPNYPSTNDLIQFMAMAQTCWYAYDDFYHNLPEDPTRRDLIIMAYVVRPPGLSTIGGADYMKLDDFLTTYPTLYEEQQWSGSDDIDVVFGDQDDKWKTYKGNVRPYCGEAILQVSNQNASGTMLPTDILARQYLDLLSTAWYDDANNNGSILGDSGLSTYYIAERVVQTMIYNSTDPDDALPTEDDLGQLVANYDQAVKQYVDEAYLAMITPGMLGTFWENEAAEYGWAGAGIWYNKIAQINGLFSEAVVNLPMIARYPEISEHILLERQKSMPTVPAESRFDPNLPAGRDGKKNNMKYERADDQKIATALNQTYIMFNDLQERVMKRQTGNALYDGINLIFKKSGLWDLRENVNIHPLAQLAVLGKTLLTNSVVAFGSGTGALGLAQILGKQSILSSVAQMIGGIMLNVAIIALAAGVLLYYVVPLMPFIYFFFAVVAWAKTIFEAMVGIPLWALAHLRYDGPGFPTQGSMYGYFLLLDIFIRPVLIIAGLVASVTIFQAIAKTFNNIFDIVTSNLTGFNTDASINMPAGTSGSISYDRGPLDELVFTVMYAIILYMIGTGCFKMIDMFPQKILRWMRSNAQSFSNIHREADVSEKVSASLQNQTQQIGGNIASRMGG